MSERLLLKPNIYKDDTEAKEVLKGDVVQNYEIYPGFFVLGTEREARRWIRWSKMPIWALEIEKEMIRIFKIP